MWFKEFKWNIYFKSRSWTWSQRSVGLCVSLSPQNPIQQCIAPCKYGSLVKSACSHRRYLTKKRDSRNKAPQINIICLDRTGCLLTAVVIVLTRIVYLLNNLGIDSTVFYFSFLFCSVRDWTQHHLLCGPQELPHWATQAAVSQVLRCSYETFSSAKEKLITKRSFRRIDCKLQ